MSGVLHKPINQGPSTSNSSFFLESFLRHHPHFNESRFFVTHKDSRMASKTIIVTGAGRGIGLAISKYLLQKSHKVVLVARTQSELEALKEQYPAQVEYLAADLTNFDVRFRATGNTSRLFLLT